MVTAAPLIADAAQRESALDTAASWIVEAPAGSGKTGLLIQRYLKLLAQADEPVEVLALTFTNKATAEMGERVLEALHAARSATTEPTNDFDRLTRSLARAVLHRDADHTWRLLDRPYLLNIRTIDSLCGEIARATPLHTGVAAFARPVNDAEPLYRRAAHAVMMRFGGGDAQLNDAVRTVLLHRDGDLAYCERVLAEMLATREQWGTLIPLGAQIDETHLEIKTLPRLNQSLEAAVSGALAACRNGFDSNTLAQITAIARQIATADGYKGEANPFAHCINMPDDPGCTGADLCHWQAIAQLLLTKTDWRKSHSANLVKATLQKHHKDQLKEIISDLQSDELRELLDTARAFTHHTYPAEQWTVAKALFRLLHHALVELQLLFAREEVCDFSEVSLAARTALRDNESSTQTLLGTRLRHLLVDEMQDTSASQYDLLDLLTQGWDGRGQTVFLVGDPKQSIYLFRQARVELFQRMFATQQLGTLRIGALRLSTNFRSGATLVAQFNSAFQTLFPAALDPDANDSGDVTFHEATAALPPKDTDGIEWTMSALPQRPKDLALAQRNRRRGAIHEARDIAHTIASWRSTQRPGTTPSIAVLTRARSHVKEITKALRSVGVPYRAIEMEGLNERQEVLDVLALTRALLHPGDRTAWLSILRAPWCGIGLADLHTLAAGDVHDQRRDSLRLNLRERAATLHPNARTRALRTLDVMDAAISHAGAASLADRVERTWRSLGGALCTTALEQENVSQFFAVLDAMEAEGETITIASLDRRLQRLFALPSHAPDAVDVMTIHKSKGLEWDLVLVPSLHRTGARDGYTALDWLELPTRGADGSRDVLIAPLPPKGDEPGSLTAYIRSVRKRRGYAELKRVFYVAATRACTQLHLSAWPEATSKGVAPIRGTLLHAAWPAYLATGRHEAAPPEATPTNVIQFPAAAEQDQSEGLSLAAAAAEPAAPTFQKIIRLQDTINPIQALHATPPVPRGTAQPTPPRFQRPKGSFGARAVGNAIHAFVERLALQVASQLPASASRSQIDAAMQARHLELPAWTGAIRSALRAGGLPPDAAERATTTVLQALSRVLSSPEGRWILEPHRAAATESAWRSGNGDDTVRVRLDRSFFAGETPMQPGDHVLWIVDFKTGNRTGATAIDTYLKEERITYEPQLRAYAQVRLRALPPDTPVMLALFYPLMDQLTAWPYEAEPTAVSPAIEVKAKAMEERITPGQDQQLASHATSAAEPLKGRKAKDQLSLFG